jgi:hypothetical protein
VARRALLPEKLARISLPDIGQTFILSNYIVQNTYSQADHAGKICHEAKKFWGQNKYLVRQKYIVREIIA